MNVLVGSFQLLIRSAAALITDAVGFISAHPRLLVVAGAAVIGMLVGSTLVRLAELRPSVAEPLTLLYGLAVAAAAASDPDTGRRLWAGVLMMTVGLLGFHLIGDVIGVRQGEFRSQVTVLMAILFGVTGFVKTHSGRRNEA